MGILVLIVAIPAMWVLNILKFKNIVSDRIEYYYIFTFIIGALAQLIKNNIIYGPDSHPASWG